MPFYDDPIGDVDFFDDETNTSPELPILPNN